jgi:hypothetical protein
MGIFTGAQHHVILGRRHVGANHMSGAKKMIVAVVSFC